MAAGAFTFYDSAAKVFMGGGDLTTATVKALLVTSSYSFSAAHDELADITNELANNFGYTTGGVTIATPVLTAITNGFRFNSANLTWTASGGNIPAWRRCIFYFSATIEGLTNPLIGQFLGDATPADVPATVDGNQLIINCPAGGWFDMTHP